jgi:hypothetical protein
MLTEYVTLRQQRSTYPKVLIRMLMLKQVIVAECGELLFSLSTVCNSRWKHTARVLGIRFDRQQIP